MDLGLTNRRALVLGASKGLGAAIARTLATEGATVIAAARSEDTTRAWISELPAEVRGRVSAARLDLADRASVDALADAVLAQGGVDVLVNNSGGPPPGTAREATAEQWLQNFQAMAAHIFHLTGRLLPPMLERGWGRIVTIGSSGIEQPIPNLALSNGIRTAVLGWSKTLSAEVADRGVTVNMVLPGRIQTDRVVQLDTNAANRTGKSVEEVAAAARAQIPVGRYGTPQEFADVVVFLASERAAYVTGSKIRIDGGQTRSL
ncbi:SDR family oxidoreductase [Arenibaculum pallidiluteum]|uniref:SDR family oxidoreductase n=1 Tax=Arenibaculum pallidiluteum TaxID=2812559 RepID=UPI001A964A40|nr:SDR family oxidoreductase [Arenibaculum pallidiluteum]